MALHLWHEYVKWRQVREAVIYDLTSWLERTDVWYGYDLLVMARYCSPIIASYHGLNEAHSGGQGPAPSTRRIISHSLYGPKPSLEKYYFGWLKALFFVFAQIESKLLVGHLPCPSPSKGHVARDVVVWDRRLSCAVDLNMFNCI